MKQVLIKNGQAVIEEIPAPQVEPGTLLVRVDYSCISVGTEMSGLKTSGLPLWKRALKQPDNVKRALEMVATHGITHTKNVIQGKLLAGNATGYSAAGTVLEVGEGIIDIQPGDRVACAGAQCAHHAEFIRVPRNLVSVIPHNLDMPSASTVTLGAIALQGVRRSQPTLGETFAVIGLGILGQLTIQMLKANGCKVIGIDLDRERIQLALDLGMDWGVHPDDTDNIQQVARLTHGIGADGVIITAATSSNEVVSTAFQMCRKKGRVVLVGDVGLHLKRVDFYQKELDFVISTSYGPGRYDSKYEEQGIDYPISYVRWTENRNMGEYLRLLSVGNIRIQKLISNIYPISQATEAYDQINKGTNTSLMVLLSYPQQDTENIARVVRNPLAKGSTAKAVRIALIGAGGFAKGMHLPNLQNLSKMFHLQAVMSRTGHNATATTRQFGANYATTDYDEVLKDPEIDAVIITTRHNLHAKMLIGALKAGKHVLVEKPMALTKHELEEIKNFYADSSTADNLPILLTGFNRRFSPFGKRIYELVKDRINPMIINYRMNAGYIPLDHWVHSQEGGGRNIGEACHIYDLFTYLVGHKVSQVSAHCIKPATNYYSSRDNFVVTLSFVDGSIATLTYTALGSKDYPKEQMEIYVDGKNIVLNDYKKLTIAGTKDKGIDNSTVDKGQKNELEAFGKVILEGGQWPIPLWQQVQATEIAFQVEEQLGGGDQCVEL